jgi:hypothetical protein
MIIIKDENIEDIAGRIACAICTDSLDGFGCTHCHDQEKVIEILKSSNK